MCCLAWTLFQFHKCACLDWKLCYVHTHPLKWPSSHMNLMKFGNNSEDGMPYMCVNYRSLAGKVSEFYIHENCTIDAAKAALPRNWGISPFELHQWRLFWSRDELENGRKFSDYNFQNGSTYDINVVWRGFGGGT